MQVATSIGSDRISHRANGGNIKFISNLITPSVNGYDYAGRRSSLRVQKSSNSKKIYGLRALEISDTISYSLDGKLFLREILPVDRSEKMIRVYDTLWNMDIVYSFMMDSRDNEVYRTIKIGNQEWLAENMRFKGFNEDSGFVYQNSRDSLLKYGRYYTWSGALQLPDSCDSSFCSNLILQKHQGVCPALWHIPTEAEWTTLNVTADSAAKEHGTRWGAALKAEDSWSEPGGLDILGFRALPSGSYSIANRQIAESPHYCTWWSSTESSREPFRAMDRELAAHSIYSTTYYDTKDRGNPIRCIKN